MPFCFMLNKVDTLALLPEDIEAQAQAIKDVVRKYRQYPEVAQAIIGDNLRREGLGEQCRLSGMPEEQIPVVIKECAALIHERALAILQKQGTPCTGCGL